jgi:hypothetical protein
METLYLINADDDDKQYLIGELSNDNGRYTFKYTLTSNEHPEGFYSIPTFRNFDEVYTSDKLFLFFAYRMYDRRRPDIKEILGSYGLEEYDEWKLLKATNGRLMTDKYELLSELNPNIH